MAMWTYFTTSPQPTFYFLTNQATDMIQVQNYYIWQNAKSVQYPGEEIIAVEIAVEIGKIKIPQI